MQQVKFFKGVENELSPLQDEVNAWIRDNNAKVINIFGNLAPQTPRAGGGVGDRAFTASDLFLVVVYEK